MYQLSFVETSDTNEIAGLMQKLAKKMMKIEKEVDKVKVWQKEHSKGGVGLKGRKGVDEDKRKGNSSMLASLSSKDFTLESSNGKLKVDPAFKSISE